MRLFPFKVILVFITVLLGSIKQTTEFPQVRRISTREKSLFVQQLGFISLTFIHNQLLSFKKNANNYLYLFSHFPPFTRKAEVGLESKAASTAPQQHRFH
jgi:hypothetical protein